MFAGRRIKLSLPGIKTTSRSYVGSFSINQRVDWKMLSGGPST